MKLYEYVIRRLVLMVFVLLAVSVIVFVITRGVPSPTYALAPYITPRMTDPQKLQTAVGLGLLSQVVLLGSISLRVPRDALLLYMYSTFHGSNRCFQVTGEIASFPALGLVNRRGASSSLDFRTQRSWRLPPRSSLYSLHFRWV